MVSKSREENPKVTTEKIKTILDRLELKAEITESCCVSKDIFLCHIRVAQLNNYISCGRGNTMEMATAGAYGELMEHLSNLIIFHYLLGDNIDEGLPYSILNDTKNILDIKELYEINDVSTYTELNRILKYIPSLNYNQHVTVPFYNVLTKKTIYLPIMLIRRAAGTNGCCTGNTPEEAIYYGLCEIMERVSIMELLKNYGEATKIPQEFLSIRIASLISRINKIGFKVGIYDISFNTGFPSVVVTFENSQYNLFRFKVATHSNLEIAIERAITEFIQISFKDKQLIFTDNPNQDTTYWDTNQMFTYNFYASLELGNCEVIRNLVKVEKISDMKAWHTFSNTTSFKEDVNIFINLFAKISMDVYIKDMSYLGFCSYTLYVPQVSGIFYKTKYFNGTLLMQIDKMKMLNNVDVLRKLRHIFLNLSVSNEEEMLLAEKYLRLFLEDPLCPNVIFKWDWFAYVFNLSPKLEMILLPEFLLGLFKYVGNEYAEAYKYFDLLENSSYLTKNESLEVEILKNIMKFKINGTIINIVDTEQVKGVLRKLDHRGKGYFNRIKEAYRV